MGIRFVETVNEDARGTPITFPSEPSQRHLHLLARSYGFSKDATIKKRGVPQGLRPGWKPNGRTRLGSIERLLVGAETVISFAAADVVTPTGAAEMSPHVQQAYLGCVSIIVGIYGSGALCKRPKAPTSTHNGCLCTTCSLSDQIDLTTILFSLYVFVSVFEPTSVVLLLPSAILSQHQWRLIVH